MDRQEFRRYLREIRGVTDPCDKCQGVGSRSYSSTATWRGGVGGQSFTVDVCDKCWGSGDMSRPWADIRKMEQARKDWEEDQCLSYLARSLGVSLTKIPRRIEQLADLCSKESKRRKLPEGESPFWWSHEWDMLASILRSLIKSKA
jgi:hypothetical protein